jgi:ATP-binding cassette subfamily G (WHITE) protein 2 (PDR)
MSVVGNFQYQNHDRDAVPVQLGRQISRAPVDESVNDEALPMTAQETSTMRGQEISQLARQLTSQSARAPHDANALFNYQEGSDLDPFSSNFNAKKYVKGMSQLSSGAGVQRLSGVSYSDMSVHGFGSDSGE